MWEYHLADMAALFFVALFLSTIAAEKVLGRY